MQRCKFLFVAASLLLLSSTQGLSPSTFAKKFTTSTTGIRSPTDRSTALPFLERPIHLDGSYIGDVGFDPLGLASKDTLATMRQAEIRHGRLAMTAAWGWPVANVFYAVSTKLLPPAQVCTGNGCVADFELPEKALKLSHIATVSRVYWGGLLFLTVWNEVQAWRTSKTEESLPLTLVSTQKTRKEEWLQLAELKHGRVAMLAVAAVWAQKLATTKITLGHQLWGETCVVNANGVSACYPQDVGAFDSVLSWEILFRVLTGYNAEPYF